MRGKKTIRSSRKRASARLNDGFVVIADGSWLIGADAVSFLALASEERGWLSATMRILFRSPRLARLLYPMLVRARKIGLRAMGRSELAY